MDNILKPSQSISVMISKELSFEIINEGHLIRIKSANKMVVLPVNEEEVTITDFDSLDKI